MVKSNCIRHPGCQLTPTGKRRDIQASLVLMIVEKPVALPGWSLSGGAAARNHLLQSPLGEQSHHLICGECGVGVMGIGVLLSTVLCLTSFQTERLHKGYPHTEAAKLQQDHILTQGAGSTECPYTHVTGFIQHRNGRRPPPGTPSSFLV